MGAKSGRCALPNTQLSTSPFIRFLPFDEGGVLYVEGKRRLWVLNAASAFIWCGLADAESIEKLAEWMTIRFRIEYARALRDIQEILSVFSSEGLLPGQSPRLLHDGNQAKIDSERKPLLCASRSGPVNRCFRIANHTFSLISQQIEFMEEFLRQMSHFEVCLSETPQTNLAVFAYFDGEDKWDVGLNDRCCFSALSCNEVIPSLMALIFMRISESIGSRLLFHSAVLGRGEEMILFPGSSGSGKTTLAAALAARGWGYYSDELAIIDPDALTVSPLPLPMSIKPGSLGALQRYYPNLPRSPVHHRADGKKVRYLLPHAAQLPNDGNRAPIKAIVFPRFRQGAEIHLASISKIQALQRLADTGSSERDLTGRDVQSMIWLVERHPCYELLFDDVVDAAAILDQIS